MSNYLLIGKNNGFGGAKNLEKTNNNLESVIRTLLGIVPYVGTALNEIVYDRRSRLKQNRINNFIAELAEFTKTVNPHDFDMEFIQSDDFSDIFEAIIKSVSLTNKKEKLEKLKVILTKGLTNKLKTDYVDTFLELVNSLNVNDIIILKHHRKLEENYPKNKDGLLPREDIDLSKKPSISDERKPEYLGFRVEQYKFHLQNLFSKALLYDDGINRFGFNPFEIMEITEFGKDFLKFIEYD